MADREHHRVGERDIPRAIERVEATVLSYRGSSTRLSRRSRIRDLGIVVGYAGAGKSASLGVAREAWERLRLSCERHRAIRHRGQEPRSRLRHRHAHHREPGASMDARTGNTHSPRTYSSSTKPPDDRLAPIGAGLSAKPSGIAPRSFWWATEQLQAIEAGAAFRSLTERATPISKSPKSAAQREAWQQNATREFATGRMRTSIDAYREHGMVHAAVIS